MMRQFIYIHRRPKCVKRLPNYTGCGPLRMAVNLFTALVLVALVAGAVGLILLVRCFT